MFILDSGKHCFVWIGRGASHDEKKNGFSRAHVSGLVPILSIKSGFPVRTAESQHPNVSLIVK